MIDINPVVNQVTPFVGVWIETSALKRFCSCIIVTPFVGVWIETRKVCASMRILSVTPFVGVWIETYYGFPDAFELCCHTLRGCVD